jgi:hypothetical protein
MNAPSNLRIGFRAQYAAMKAAQSLVKHYRETGDDRLEAYHDRRSLQIQGDLIAELCALAGLTAEELRESIG